MTAGPPIDQASLVTDLAAELSLPADADSELARLVADWAGEADSQPDPAAVLAFQREDLDGAVAEEGGAAAGLRLAMLRRRVARLAASTYTLGTAIVEGTVADDDAREQGRSLLGQCEDLGGAAQELGQGPLAASIRRSLGDATMEALYATERAAMSPRLARHAADVSPAAAGVGPPDLRPA